MKKRVIALALSLTLCSLSAQERGVTPANHPTIQPSGHPTTTYAVVVGISNYQDEGIPDLRFADRDAEAFANFLRSPAGGSLDHGHLKVLTNEAATGAQIAIALDWLVEVADEGDLVFIYFSGHGDVEAKRITQPGYLLGWDAPSRVYMAGGAVNVRDLQIITSTLSVENKAKVFLITDACRSGKLSGSEIDGAQLTSQNLARRYENEIKILSCQPNEYSIEGEQWGGGRGAFSYHLIDGLYGLADRNGDLSVNLMEIGRYLQDKVTTEVAPQSQVPMTVGDFTEKLVRVNPDLLEQIKEGKKGQLQLFTPIDSRGMEEDVLAAADSNIVEMYATFQKTLADKQFLEPANACADFYYEILSKEPQLENLHSSMRRNYAAALQDDAQQVINKMLKSDTEVISRSNVTRKELYGRFPGYLERAAELLGEDHYMYPQLKARQLFFEAQLLLLGEDNLGLSNEKTQQALATYRLALQTAPDLALIHYEMARTFGYISQLDSAEYHVGKAVELVPSWVLPYTMMASLFLNYANDKSRAEYYLDKAMQLDSNAWITRVRLGQYFQSTGQFDKAESEFNKALQIDSSYISTYITLGLLYTITGRYEEAEQAILKAIQFDSTQWVHYNTLGYNYFMQGKLEASETALLKAMKLVGRSNYGIHNDLGNLYVFQKRYEEAEQQFNKVIQLNPGFEWAYVNMAWVFSLQGKKEEALNWLEQALEIEKWSFEQYQQVPELDELRHAEGYKALMKKYFPDQFKD